MATSTHIFVVLLALISYALAEDSDVLTLRKDNFQATIDSHPLIAVEFYAPWCGHCKALAPEWEKAATQLKDKVPIAKVDCTEEADLCQTYGVQGYPTLKLFRSGEVSPFEVARKAEPIVAFLNAELEPALTVLKSQSDIDSFIAAHPIAAIGYFDNEHDDRYSSFNQLASKLRHTTSFGVVTDADVAKDNARPTVVFHRDFDDPIVTFKGDITSDSLTSWIARQKIPLVGEINGDTYSNYVASGLPIGYLFVNPNEDNTGLLGYVKTIANKIREKVNIAWIDNNKFAQHGVRLGLTGKTVPAFVLEDSTKGTRYVYPEADTFSEETLTTWFDKYSTDELQAHIKSEEIPADNSGPVKVVVAHTFDQIVKDTSKDVLVEFYAPWCGHCKKLAPVWEELGETFQSSPNVVIAKIDATANDVPPQLNIRGFPTIIFFPAGNKDQPVEYSGSRSLDDLKSFLTKNSSGAEAAVEEPATKTHDEL